MVPDHNQSHYYFPPVGDIFRNVIEGLRIVAEPILNKGLVNNSDYTPQFVE
jgi:hypothetical protein